MTPSEARWLSKCTLVERATDTNRGYTVTACQVCWQGWGQAGLCEWQRFLSSPGTWAGLPSPPPTATPWPSHLGGAGAARAVLDTTHGTGDVPCQGICSQGKGCAGLQDPPRGAMYDCASPTVSSGCQAVWQLSAWWISVSLSSFLQQSVLTKGLCQAMQSRELLLSVPYYY